MSKIAGNLSPGDVVILLERIEPHLQILDRESVRLQEHITDQRLSAMLRSAENLNKASAAAGHRAFAGISQNIISLLHSQRRSRSPMAADTVEALLIRVDALRLLKEEISRPAALQMDTEAFLRELDMVAAQTASGGGTSGRDMAA